jgi:hypothetical protein
MTSKLQRAAIYARVSTGETPSHPPPNSMASDFG